MKIIIFILSALLLFTLALSWDLVDDEAETNFEDEQIWDWAEESDYSSKIQEKNIITNIFNSLFSKIIPTLGEIKIQSLNLGPAIGSLSNVTVLHANETQYTIEPEGSLSVKNLTLVLDELVVTGYYNFISLTLPGPISLTGQGDFSIELENFILSTGLTLKMGVSKLNVTDLPNFYLYLNRSTLNFEHLMGNEPVGDLLNSIISDALPKLIEAAYGELMDQFGPVIRGFLSDFINCAKDHLTNVNYCLQPHNLDLESLFE